VIKAKFSNCSPERKLMKRTKPTTEPQMLRKRAESRWENEGGATIAPEISSGEPLFTKTIVSVGKSRSLRARIKRFWLGVKNDRHKASAFLSRHSQPLMQGRNDKTSASQPVARVRTHRGLAALSIRPGSEPSHMPKHGSMSAHEEIWPCFIRIQIA
jgi:hypothetical protein